MSAAENDKAVAVWCSECLRSFYVTDEPECCPYCGNAEVGTEYGVVVRPH